MRRMVLSTFCEPCAQQGLEVESTTTKEISFDRGPVKEMDFCPACARYLLAPLLGAYDACEAEAPNPKQKARLAQKAQEARELTLVPPAGDDASKPGAARTRHKEAAHALPEPAPKPAETVVCGLCAEEVDYSNRKKHANEAHNLEMYDIVWNDPNNIIKVFCDAHEACLKNKVGFTTGQGVSGHRRHSAQELLAAN